MKMTDVAIKSTPSVLNTMISRIRRPSSMPVISDMAVTRAVAQAGGLPDGWQRRPRRLPVIGMPAMPTICSIRAMAWGCWRERWSSIVAGVQRNIKGWPRTSPTMIRWAHRGVADQIALAISFRLQ
jgi:hypothetical protein